MHYHCIQLNCNIHSGYIDGDRDFKHIIVYAYMCPTAESASSRWKCHASNVPFTLADLSANKSDRHKSAEKSELTVVAFSINLFTAPTLGCFFFVSADQKNAVRPVRRTIKHFCRPTRKKVVWQIGGCQQRLSHLQIAETAVHRDQQRRRLPFLISYASLMYTSEKPPSAEH